MTVATMVSLLAQWSPRFCAAATHKLISGLNLFICAIVYLFFYFFFRYAQLVFYSLVSLTRLATPSVGTLIKFEFEFEFELLRVRDGY